MISTATLANGCFWCSEAVFQRLKGVNKVTSGYANSPREKPTYEDVGYNNKGEAEAIQVEFDPEKISYQQLLEIFWSTHDPTTPNRQGNDVGPQYRSVVFYHNNTQKEIAETTKISMQAHWEEPIITEITKYTNFYPAEKYHQNYYNNNKNQPYCELVINPKLQKIRKEFSKFLQE